MAFWGLMKWLLRVLVTCAVFCIGRIWDLTVFVGRRGAADHRGYEMFLSFRGVDLRRGFVSHLYHALTTAGYNVFLDSHEINIGDDISAAIHHAVEHSRIFIIVFSRNFAESDWCLREIALIVRLLQRNGSDNECAIAIPVFYDVTPSQVRHPHHCDGSPFGKAFEEHERRGKYRQQEIDEWKAALHTISNRRGLSLQEDCNGYDAKLVKRLVKEVGKLRRTARL